MSVYQSIEATALELVGIVIRNGCRPGQGIPVQSLYAQWGSHRPTDQFNQALAYAVQVGWLEYPTPHGFVYLTQAGYDAYRTVACPTTATT